MIRTLQFHYLYSSEVIRIFGSSVVYYVEVVECMLRNLNYFLTSFYKYGEFYICSIKNV